MQRADARVEHLAPGVVWLHQWLDPDAQRAIADCFVPGTAPPEIGIEGRVSLTVRLF